MGKTKAAALLLAAFFLSSCSTEYAPIVSDNHRYLREESTLISKQHYDRVEVVLRYYGVEFERNSDTELTILAPMERETLWNITTKAEDAQWLAAHPPDE